MFNLDVRLGSEYATDHAFLIIDDHNFLIIS